MPAPAQDIFMPDALFWAENTDHDLSSSSVVISLEPDLGDRLFDAEIRLLSCQPRSPAEMIVQLEIICEGLEGGGRSDGLDVRALRNIQTVLAVQEAHEQARLTLFNTLRAKGGASTAPRPV